MTAQRERLTYSVWGTAYCVAKGVRLLRVFSDPGSHKVSFALADDDGEATEALREWRSGDPMIGGRTLAEARQIVLDKLHGVIDTQNQEMMTDAAAAN